MPYHRNWCVSEKFRECSFSVGTSSDISAMFGSLRKIVRILRRSLGKSRSWQDKNLTHLTHQKKLAGIEPSCRSPESVTAWKTATLETDEITTTQICVETATSTKTSANKIVKYWHGHGYLLFRTRNDVFWNSVYPPPLLSFKVDDKNLIQLSRQGHLM